jgi:hypothetical protein
VVTRSCRPTRGVSYKNFVEFLVNTADIIEINTEDELEERPPADAAMLLCDAIENFNYPDEMGEDVHESVEAIATILSRVPVENARERRWIKRLYTELSKGYSDEQSYRRARQRGSRSTRRIVELLDPNDRWVSIDDLA